MPALVSPPLGNPAFLPPLAYPLVAVFLLFIGTLLARARFLRSHISPRLDAAAAPMEKAPLLPSPPLHRPSPSQPPLTLPEPVSGAFTPQPSSTSQPSSPEIDFPRRRSYNKMSPAGTEINGEIIVAEGWRRHTKVFGGGVCMACQESERRLASVGAGASAVIA